ncbi:uncharacterized protein LOC128470503 [Spea bombifrons]|uniref:uncharacterized protein LOC128470503 n=1 Tax=Spea bombifrons TaxID=233779 RepID=UPI00234ACB5F|nr:uncharacterized protein LOC128470503 [Spea bombifrons]
MPFQVGFHDVAASFTGEQWMGLESWKKELYRNAVTEIHQALLTLGHTIANPDIVFQITKCDKSSVRIDCSGTERESTVAGLPDLLLRVKEETDGGNVSSDEKPNVERSENLISQTLAECPVITSVVSLYVKEEQEEKVSPNSEVKPTSDADVQEDSLFSIKQEEEVHSIDNYNSAGMESVVTVPCSPTSAIKQEMDPVDHFQQEVTGDLGDIIPVVVKQENVDHTKEIQATRRYSTRGKARLGGSKQKSSIAKKLRVISNILYQDAPGPRAAMDSRRIGATHFIFKIPPTEKKQNPQKRCRVCYSRGQRKDTPLYCPDCPGEPALCLGNCFKLYHTTAAFKSQRVLSHGAHLDETTKRIRRLQMLEGMARPFRTLPCFMNDPIIKGQQSPRRPLDLKEETPSTGPPVWCKCGKCCVFDSEEETVCCHNISSLQSLLNEDCGCITNHHFFRDMCLGHDWLNFLFRFLGRTSKKEDILCYLHKLRRTAYRVFTVWAHDYLDRRKYKPIPACAIKAVRDSFPYPEELNVGVMKMYDYPAAIMALD